MFFLPSLIGQHCSVRRFIRNEVTIALEAKGITVRRKWGRRARVGLTYPLSCRILLRGELGLVLSARGLEAIVRWGQRLKKVRTAWIPVLFIGVDVLDVRRDGRGGHAGGVTVIRRR